MRARATRPVLGLQAQESDAGQVDSTDQVCGEPGTAEGRNAPMRGGPRSAQAARQRVEANTLRVLRELDEHAVGARDAFLLVVVPYPNVLFRRFGTNRADCEDGAGTRDRYRRSGPYVASTWVASASGLSGPMRVSA